MVPSAFAIIDRMPFTPTGKIDRRALKSSDALTNYTTKEFIAPRDRTEFLLAQVWEELLATAPIGVNDNFFDRGGHSLLAVRLLSQIEKRMGVRLNVASIFENPTVEMLANRIRKHLEPLSYSPLVKLQGGESRSPFFCVHPIGGTVFCYVELARHLGPNQPFYGLQAPGLDAGQSSYKSIEEMALHYIQAMRTVQPEGPYRLGGWSMGGVVAFEMARQLQAQGQEVSLLALFDSRIINGNAGMDEKSLVVNFAYAMGLDSDQLNLSGNGFHRETADQQLGHVLQRATQYGVVPPGVELSGFQRLFQVYKTNMQAASDYRPQPYTGRLILFNASQHLDERNRNHAEHWSKLAFAVSAQDVPGNHFTMIREPNVSALAEALLSYL
jgi:thioesterase domain-containing protein/acyl carrier protein